MFARKSGLQMLLSSMGVEIDPAEIMSKYNEAKDIMPKLAAFVNTLDERLKRIETQLEGIATETVQIGHDSMVAKKNSYKSLKILGYDERAESNQNAQGAINGTGIADRS